MSRQTSVMWVAFGLGFAALAAAGPARAAEVTIPMTLIDETGTGTAIGTILAADGADGLTLTPNLRDLPPGPHGMHLHEKPSCGPGEKDGRAQAGLAAGGHWDPEHTGKHMGPGGGGHRGDLPVLVVAADGTAQSPVQVPSLSVADLRGHSLMIHRDGDNYSDQPMPLGGGGARIACGVVPGA